MGVTEKAGRRLLQARGSWGHLMSACLGHTRAARPLATFLVEIPKLPMKKEVGLS